VAGASDDRLLGNLDVALAAQTHIQRIVTIVGRESINGSIRKPVQATP
jgi:hypothetical protein